MKKIMVSLELYWMWSHFLHHDGHIKPKPMEESRKSLNQIWVASTSRLHERKIEFLAGFVKNRI